MSIVTSDPVVRYLSHRSSKTLLAARLRPMSTGEILDSALRLYQRLGLNFLRLSVVPTLLCLASIAFVLTYVLPEMLLFANDQGSFGAHVGNVVFAVVLAMFVGGPIFLAGLSYTTCLVVSMVSDYMVGNAVDPAAAEAVARRSMGRLLVVNMRELVIALSGVLVSTALVLVGEYVASVTPESSASAGLIASLGLMGVMIGGMVCLSVLASDALVPPVTVLEDLGPKMAGKRGRSLMKRSGFHPAGQSGVWSIYFLLGFVFVVVWGGLEICMQLFQVSEILTRITAGFPLRPLILPAFELLPPFAALWIVIPIWATTITLLYFDRRIRLEGFDIEILGRNLAQSSRKNRFEL